MVSIKIAGVVGVAFACAALAGVSGMVAGAGKEPKAGGGQAKAAGTGIAVVELFTSEGCSSCPPAERLLNDLAKSRAQGTYLLSWHVDYWDNLGWKDRFATSAASNRQRSYATAMQRRGVGSDQGAGVYTPQIVINGTTGMVGSRRSAVEGAIDAAKKTQPKATLALTRSEKSADRTVAIDATFSNLPAGATAMAVVVEDGLSSSVRSGENAGSSLLHDRVVRAFSEQSDLKDKTSFVLTLPDNLNLAQTSVIVFVQEKGLGAIVGAAEIRAAAEKK